MAPRASSPALSENEFDITNALFGGDDINGKEKGRAHVDLGIDLDVDKDGSDDEAFIAATQAASNRKASNLQGRTVKKGGGFQAMGLNAGLLKAITRKGFTVPTPIQRKAIPLIMEGVDVVGMARTGSGKTAAFVIPMIEKLKSHSAKVGARAIILSPSRELAMQTMKVVKELGRGTDLRSILLVGGDSLEDQFSAMTTNPDIIIATPGRFLHLKVEMGLDLFSVQYVVFDECDRLFEMGFATQLGEILHFLPTSRQTLLLSATLPSSIVEFSRAGLQEPKLIRLDADSKMSPDLETAFFTVKSGERDGALFHILEKVIKMPTGATERAKEATSKDNGKKRKRAVDTVSGVESPTAYSTVVFAATKHRVEYLASMLKAAGYSVSYVYGTLDQTARKQQVQNFRAGLSHILVTSDVAARGLDLPLLKNVVNYDFPSAPKVFVHRVGRTARAGNKGSAYSLVREADFPYLVDLQLFLGRRLVFEQTSNPSFSQDVVVGGFIQEELEAAIELTNRVRDSDSELESLQSVAEKGEKQYIRTRNSAATQSVKRAKELLASGCFTSINPFFHSDIHDVLRERQAMLERISSFRPAETVFEIGKRGTASETADVMRRRRQQVERQKKKQRNETTEHPSLDAMTAVSNDIEDDILDGAPQVDYADTASDSDDLEVSVSQPTSQQNKKDESWKNDEYFMSWTPRANLAEEKAYGVHSGSGHNSNFVMQARDAAMDLTNDEIQGFQEASRARGMRWDKKKKDYVSRTNDDDGSKGVKMVRGESGLKIPASFRSGRFDEWRKSNKMGRLPRVGEMETQNRTMPQLGGRRFKHKAEKAPKEADRFRDDYHVQKKRVEEAKQKRIGKFKDGGAKNELKGIDDVRKQRNLKEKRREKNARPSKKRKL